MSDKIKIDIEKDKRDSMVASHMADLLTEPDEIGMDKIPYGLLNRVQENMLLLYESAHESGRESMREEAAGVAEEFEKKHFDAIGNPMIPEFKAIIAKAIREID